MAKANKETTGDPASIVSRTEVALHSEHRNTPNLYEIKVSGRRVGYVTDEAPFPVTMLPAKTIKLALTPDEIKAIVPHAREIVAGEAAKRAAESSDLERLLAGE